MHDTLSQRDLNRILNRNFGSLVTGNPSSGEIANYASLDPVSGFFTLKGNLPVGTAAERKQGKIGHNVNVIINVN